MSRGKLRRALSSRLLPALTVAVYKQHFSLHRIRGSKLARVSYETNGIPENHGSTSSKPIGIPIVKFALLRRHL